MFFSKQSFLSTIEDELNKVVDAMTEIIMEHWRSKGHTLTGEFEASARKEVYTVSETVVANLWLNDYYQWVNEGVAAEDIPFSPGSGAGTSAYIDGLVRYFQLRASLTGKEALKAAFATANTHIKKGMEGSGFFTDAIDEAEPIIDEGLEMIFGNVLNVAVDKLQSQLTGTIKIVL